MTALRRLVANAGPTGLLVITVLACGLLDARILTGQNLAIVLVQSLPVLMLALGGVHRAADWRHRPVRRGLGDLGQHRHREHA